MSDGSTAILGQYSILSQPGPGGTDNFDDNRLTRIARATGKSVDEVASTLARFLLQNFSMDRSFLSKSTRLGHAYNALRERYLTSISDLREGRDVGASRPMQNVLARTRYLQNKKQVVQRVILEAVLAHDEILSFPDLYQGISRIAPQSEMELPPDVNAYYFFERLNQEKNPMVTAPLPKPLALQRIQAQNGSTGRIGGRRSNSAISLFSSAHGKTIAPATPPIPRSLKRTQSRQELPLLETMGDANKRLSPSTRAKSEISLPRFHQSSNGHHNKEEKLARFFYKHVALYWIEDEGEVKILTWRDLVEEWIQQEKANRRKAYKMVLGLRFHWLRPLQCSTFFVKGGSPSFQLFVYHKTIELLEKRIQVKLDEDLRQMLLGKMEDETFRMHLIYYLGHIDYLIQKGPEKEDPAYQWLLAIRRFLVLRNQFEYTSTYGPILFRWVFDAQDLPITFAEWDNECDCLPSVSHKRQMDFIVQGIIRIGDFFSKQEEFRKNALQFFAILNQCSTDLEGKIKFFGDLSQLKYCLLSEEEIGIFLGKTEFNRTQYKTNVRAVTKVLDKVGAEGQSNQFLRLFCCSGWDNEKVELASEAVLQVGAENTKVEEVLAIYLNVLNGRIDRNFLTAANAFNKISVKGEKEVFAGRLPSKVDCDVGRMEEALEIALEYQQIYHFTDVESFQFYLWLLSQERTSLEEKWKILRKVEAFVGCRVEKALVLSLAQAPIRSSEILEALKELEVLRGELLTDHAGQLELPSEFCSAIQIQMDRIFFADQLEEEYFLVHPTREISKYISSGFLFFDLEPSTITRILAAYDKEVQMPFGQSSPTRRVIRGGWRLDSKPPVFELHFVNSDTNTQENLRIPLIIDPGKIEEPVKFFQWVSEMAEGMCSDLHPSSEYHVPEAFAQFESSVRDFLQLLKTHLRMKVVLFAKPSPLSETKPVDKSPSFSGDTCPKELASQILQGKAPDVFPLKFDNGSQQEDRYVHCKVSEEDPFGFTLSLSVKDGKKLLFQVRYHRALVKKEEDFQELLQQQIGALQGFYYEYKQRTAPSPSKSLE